MAGISHDLFVCHARSDGADAASALTRDLEQRGLTCWIAPRDIAPGMSWPNAIVDGIARSRAMILLVTEAANASPEVEKEVSLAAHLHKTTFPVRVSDIPLSGTLLYHLQTRQWRDLFDDRERALDEIAEQVRRLRAEAAVASDIPSADGARPLAGAPPAGLPQAPPAWRAARWLRKFKGEFAASLPSKQIAQIYFLLGIVAVVGAGAAGVWFVARPGSPAPAPPPAPAPSPASLAPRMFSAEDVGRIVAQIQGQSTAPAVQVDQAIASLLSVIRRLRELEAAEPERHFEVESAIEDLMMRGDPTKARKVLQTQVERMTRINAPPADAAVAHRELASLLSVFDLDDAKAEYDRAIELNPRDATAREQRGNVLLAQGKPDRALADYAESARLNPSSAAALSNLGKVYADRGDAERAIADYSEAIRLDPTNASVYVSRADVYALKGNYQLAVADYTRAIEIEPNSAVARTRRGNAYLALRAYDQAATEFQTLLALKPDDADALSDLGRTYRAIGRYTDAESVLRRSLAARERAVGPDHPQIAAALYDLALVKGAQGQQAEQVALLERALAIEEKALSADHPYTAAILSQLGMVKADQHEYDRAEALLNRALAIWESSHGRISTEVAATLYDLALVKEDQARYAEAEALLQRAYNIYDQTRSIAAVDALSQLGVVAQKQGKLDQAQAYLNQALRAARAGTQLNRVRFNLALLLEAKASYDEAIAQLSALARDDPSNVPYQRELARALSRQGQALLVQNERPRAIESLKQSLALSRRLAAADPSYVQSQLDVALTNLQLAMAGDDAANRLRETLEIVSALQARGPLSPEQANHLQQIESQADDLKKRNESARPGGIFRVPR